MLGYSSLVSGAGSKSTRRSTAADASTVSVLDAAVGSYTIEYATYAGGATDAGSPQFRSLSREGKYAAMLWELNEPTHHGLVNINW